MTHKADHSTSGCHLFVLEFKNCILLTNFSSVDIISSFQDHISLGSQTNQ